MIDYYGQYYGNQETQPDNLATTITDYYSELLGRTPDQGGFNHWMSVAPDLIAGGGDAALRREFTNAAQQHTDDKAYYTANKAAPFANNITPEAASHWSDYLTRAGQQQRSMNTAPGVYNIPQDSGSLFNTAEQQAAGLNSFKDYWAEVGSLTDADKTEEDEEAVA